MIPINNITRQWGGGIIRAGDLSLSCSKIACYNAIAFLQADDFKFCERKVDVTEKRPSKISYYQIHRFTTDSRSSVKGIRADLLLLRGTNISRKIVSRGLINEFQRISCKPTRRIYCGNKKEALGIYQKRVGQRNNGEMLVGSDESKSTKKKVVS